MNNQLDITRIPPQSIDSEKAVLGSMLQDESACLIGLDILDMDHFYLDAHKWIFGSIKELVYKNKPVDQLTVVETLIEKKFLDDVGGPTVIADLINRVPSSSNVKYYAERVREKWAMRTVLAQTYSIQESIFEDDSNSMETIDTAITELVTSRSKTEKRALSKIDMPKAIDYIQKLATDPDKIGVVFSGIKAIDSMVKGFRPGELYIFAGRPGMGKTALGLSIARKIAKNDKSVGFFSLEMSEDEIAIRLLSAESGVYHSVLSDGNIGAHHYDKVNPAAERIAEYDLYFDDSSHVTPTNILTRSRLIATKHNLNIIIVDYLQIMGSEGKYDTRNDEVGKISSGLKAIAKQLHIPVIALAQLNRDVEKRGNRRPTMSDLRDSGAIEQDANLIGLLYRDGYYNKNEDQHLTDIMIVKNRRGPTGTKQARFKYETMDFEDIDFVHNQDPDIDFTPHEGEGDW